MSSPMPISPTMCTLCFFTIYEGEHFVDPSGQKWDSHSWCHLMDMAMCARKNADKVRKARGVPTVKEEEAEERRLLDDGL